MPADNKTMRTLTRTGALRILVTMVALLLPAGALAATTVDPSPAPIAAIDGRVGAAGLGASGLVEEPGTTRTAEITVGPSTPPATSSALGTSVPPTSPTTRPSTATAAGPPTTRARGTGATLPTLPSGAPVPLPPPPTGIPNIAPASSWSAQNDDVGARMRIDPPAPVAGQAVRFTIDYSSADPCCTVLLAFGDGSNYSLNNGTSCSEPSALSPGAHTATASHVYAGPGAYKASLTVIVLANQCGSSLEPSGSPPVPVIRSAHLTACVGVGPGPSAQKGCSPFPDFGPDDIVSPVIDPFCQIRSDCTKASTPR